MKKAVMAVALLLVLMLASAGTARADTINYTLTGWFNGFSASWTMPGNPDPLSTNAVSFTAAVSNLVVNGTFLGNSSIVFYSLFPYILNAQGLAGPGFTVGAAGIQLFGGSLSDPTMYTGNFTLYGPLPYTLRASSVVTPEPGTLLLLLASGLVALGFRSRRYVLQ